MSDFISLVQDKDFSDLLPVEHFLRENALAKFLELGLPDPKQESWRYFDLRQFSEIPFEISAVDLTDEVISVYSANKLSENCLVFINGIFSSELSSDTISGDNNCVISSQLKVNGHIPQIKNIGSLIGYKEDPFVALNSCFFRDSVSIREAEGQLQIMNIVDGEQTVFPRIFVNTAKGEKLEVLETYHSTSSAKGLLVPVSEYQQEEASELTVNKIVELNPNLIYLSYQYSVLASRANHTSFTVNLSGKSIKNNIVSVLNGVNAKSNLLGLNLGDESEYFENQTVLDHAVPNCESYEVYKGIYGGGSKGVFDGTIIVRQDAQKTNAIQSNQGLLLSDKATSFSKPQLKIWADDVKCTHGATCGNLDEEALFYLRSRGIKEKEARLMLIQAFLEELFGDIENKDFGNYSQNKIEKKISEII